MKRADYEREPCTCGTCRQAGVDQLNQRRDPYSGKWLHGYELKRLHDAAALCADVVRKLAAKRVMK